MDPPPSLISSRQPQSWDGPLGRGATSPPRSGKNPTGTWTVRVLAGIRLAGVRPRRLRIWKENCETRGGPIPMEAIKDALQEELEQTVARLKKLGGAVVFEDYPGALVADGQDDASSDAVSINEQRELAFEVRGRPVERANRLSEALDRLRSGDYGICQICGEPISAGRLQAIPEVTTCVACQDAAERQAVVSRQGG